MPAGGLCSTPDETLTRLWAQRVGTARVGHLLLPGLFGKAAVRADRLLVRLPCSDAAAQQPALAVAGLYWRPASTLGRAMRSLPNLPLCVVLSWALAQMASPAQAAELCAPLPVSVQNVSVSYISDSAQLQKLDDLLDSHLQPCLQSPTPQNTKALCSHGRVLGEQVLRVIGRIDEAGKKNAFLSNVKLKSYKTASGLLDRMKKLSADKVCP